MYLLDQELKPHQVIALFENRGSSILKEAHELYFQDEIERLRTNFNCSDEEVKKELERYRNDAINNLCNSSDSMSNYSNQIKAKVLNDIIRNL